MKKVFTTRDDAGMLHHLRNILSNHGIVCFTRYENTVGSAAGEVPPIVCWPELWIHDDDRLEEAMTLIRRVKDLRLVQPAWSCPGCGERLEPQFTACWQCGTQRDTPAWLAGQRA